MTQPAQGERSLGELLGELAKQTSTLVRDEVRLAKTEMTQKATEAGKDAGLIGAGAAVAHAGFLALLAGIVAALSQLIPLWIAAILVGIVVGGVGYVFVQKGMRALRGLDLSPKETIQTLKEEKLWVQDQMR